MGLSCYCRFSIWKINSMVRYKFLQLINNAKLMKIFQNALINLLNIVKYLNMVC